MKLKSVVITSIVFVFAGVAFAAERPLSSLAVRQDHLAAKSPVRIIEGLFDQKQKETLGLKEAAGAETITIFAPKGDGDMQFNNHPQLAVFKSKLYLTWVGHPVHEVGEGARVFYSSSDDGRNWAKPVAISSEMRASGGWVASDDSLLCLLIKANDELRGKNTVERPITEFCKTTDGIHWTKPQMLIENAMPSESAKRLESGRFIMPCHGLGSGKFADVRVARIMYNDSADGTGAWTEADLPQPEKVNTSSGKKVARAIEPSWYKRPDGTLVMLFRDLDFEAKNRTWRLLAAESKDDGKTWTKPLLTNIPDSDSMQCAGRLPDGSVYFVNNPVPTRRRVPLSITMSKDGVVFDRALLLRGTPPTLRFAGISKTPGYSYPGSIVFNGYLYIAYATNKEDVEVTRIPLEAMTANEKS